MNHLFKGLWKKGLWVTDVSSSEHMSQIIELEKECFPEALQATEEMYTELFECEDAVTRLLFKKDKLIGLISGTDIGIENTPVTILSHPDIAPIQKRTFYMENLSLSESSRSAQNILYLFQEMSYALRSYDFDYVSADARVSNGFSRKMQKIFKAKFIATDPNWQGMGEPFDYLLIDLSEIPTSTKWQRRLQIYMGKFWRFIYT